MVFEESIYKGEHLMPDGGVDYLIYPGQGKNILWASIVQVGVINTNSLLPILLWNDHHVC